MTPKRSIAIGIAGRRLRAVEGRASGDGLEIIRAITTEVPESVDLADAQALGRAVAQRLRATGISRGRAVLAVPRESVSLKRLSLPAADRYELPGMVRLAMQRDLPFDPADAVIDFIVVSRTSSQTHVLVAAMQRRMIDHLRDVARAAKFRVDRVSLRCMGLSAILRTSDRVADEQNAVLGIDLTGDAAEIVFIANGSIRFSRAARIAPSDDVESVVDAVVTEVRRSWMSYRMTEDAPEVAGGIVLGPAQLANECATAVGDLLKVRVDVLDRHPRISTAGAHSTAPRPDIETVWPLAGLLLERQLGVDAIDFASPTMAPDRGARRRLVAYAAAAAAFLLAATLWIVATKNLQDLRAQSVELADLVRERAQGHYRYERDVRRVQHLDRWRQTHVDWLSHLAAIGEQLPGNDRVVLDLVQGSISNATVSFDPRRREWSMTREIVFSIDGEAASQSIRDDLRLAFAVDARYVVQPSGQDGAGGKRYPNPFKITLRSNIARPEVTGATERESAQSPDASQAGDESSEVRPPAPRRADGARRGGA